MLEVFPKDVIILEDEYGKYLAIISGLYPSVGFGATEYEAKLDAEEKLNDFLEHYIQLN